MRTETRLYGNYSCESGPNSKINSVKLWQKLYLAIIIHPFSHFIHSFFKRIKLISISRRNLGLMFSISQKLKDFSLKFELNFSLNLELNLPHAYNKRVFSTKNLLAPIIISGNSPATLTLSYSTEDLSRIIFCECVLGVGNIQ